MTKFAVTVSYSEEAVFTVEAVNEDEAREIIESRPHDELFHDDNIEHEVINADYAIDDVSPVVE
jgi:hypothetical protein